MNWKKLCTIAMAGLMATALFAGCSDDKPAAPGSPGKTAEAPPPPQRSIDGVEFKFGDKKGKAYALMVPKHEGSLRDNRIVFMKDAVYLHGYVEKNGEDHYGLYRMELKNDAFAAPVSVGDSKGIGDIATNGKVVLCRPEKDYGKIASYDGNAMTVAGKWPGSMAGIVGSDEFFILEGMDELKIGTFSGGEIKDLKDVGKTPNADGVGYDPVYAEKDELYLAAAGPDEERDLIAMDRTGHEIRRFAGFEESNLWAVTQNYVVTAMSDFHDGKAIGTLRIYDRATGKKIDEPALNDFEPGEMCAMSGNSILVWDNEERDKFYIIDL